MIAARFSRTRAARRSRAACTDSVNVELNDSKRMIYLVLGAAGLHLVSENLRTSLLGLSFVDVLHEDTLVLENVTLGLLVQLVVPCNKC
jgi:hypothetical protein